ncbi:MAG: acyl-CoA reductase [Bacteroidetes bacterium]|nr:acyl-CoA reductase [Bacteroidota bacterium]
MNIEKRIDLLKKLGQYMQSDETDWRIAQEQACNMNAWFTKESVDLSVQNIVNQYLQPPLLKEWLSKYSLPVQAKKVGIIMAGNIPLVGFHDFICSFVCAHQQHIKLSSKDDILLRKLIGKLYEWEPNLRSEIFIADNLKNCESYIATGNNNSARYFEQYFGKYPHIIRRNRTSVAILEGNETKNEFTELANDVFSYFGLGCRNVTQLCVPKGYDFSLLLESLKPFSSELMLHHKYKNNYDYYFAIYMLNKVPFLTNDSLMLVENELPFSAVSVLHFRYYTDMQQLAHDLEVSGNIQTIVGKGFTPFGAAQIPSLSDYADGVDTMSFLCSI